VQTYCGGMVETNGYLVMRGKAAFVVDAPEGMADWIEEHGRNFTGRWTGLFLTHGHWDHIVDAARIQKRFRMPVFIHRDSAPLLEDPSVQAAFNPFCRVDACRPERVLEREIEIAEVDCRVRLFHCPGHCPGSLCFYFPEDGILFGGDVLFAGGVGRWDLPGGSRETLFHGITKNLLTLPDETRIYPGHGPSTTIGQERRTNLYLLDLKTGRSEKTLK